MRNVCGTYYMGIKVLNTAPGVVCSDKVEVATPDTGLYWLAYTLAEGEALEEPTL